jgi:lysophospholipase L1-like esterase
MKPVSQIVLFGDSITQQSFSPGGFGVTLADRYQRRADVLNRGFSGYNTRWALEMLPLLRDSTCSSTCFVTVFFGANDASLIEQNPRQHVPIEEYGANLKQIVKQLRSNCPAATIVIVCPPPVCHEQRLTFLRTRYPETFNGELERTNEAAGKYAATAEAVAAELSVPCVNLWQAMQDSAPNDAWHSFLSDGLHLSPQGNAFVAQALVDAIQASAPSLAVKPCAHTGGFGNSGSTSEGLVQWGPWHDRIGIDTADHATAFRAHGAEETAAAAAQPDLTDN